MLPKFIARGHVGDEWFFDFDRGGWVQMGEEWKRQEPDAAQEDWARHVAELPEGITMIVMDSPDKIINVHNAIADAVGEPRVAPPSPTHIPRRF